MALYATVCKQFTFHACHQLPHHRGKCSRWHGHTYKLEVFVKGEINGVYFDQPASYEGMVIDFDQIKGAYESVIEPFVEHQNLNETLEGRVARTTAELMARWIYVKLDHVLPGLVKVRLWETPTSYAEVEGLFQYGDDEDEGRDETPGDRDIRQHSPGRRVVDWAARTLRSLRRV